MAMSSKTVSVLGCGWLGFPLAQHLLQLGYTVKGSTTTPAKKELLKKSDIVPYCFRFEPHCLGEPSDFFVADVLFLNIPFRRDLTDPFFYKSQVESIVSYLENSPIRFVIFASSTAIYPENNTLITERYPLDLKELRVQALWESENLLRYNKHFQATILRFAGLYGGERKIGKFLAGRKELAGARNPMNLVHLEDCVKIIAGIIQRDIRGETFNVCSDDHPTRQEVYSWVAKQEGKTLPKFSSSQEKFKIISNAKLKKALHYQFKFSSPLKS